MPRKAANRPPSLLDSKQYQSALKVNQIETNKLEKMKSSVEMGRKRMNFLQSQDWTSTQQWLLDITSNSGYADLEKYNKVLVKDDEKLAAEAPKYYFMYGIRIGERPQLLKNFLGKKSKPKKTFQSETKQKRLQAVSNGLLHEDCKDEEEKEGKLQYNQIIIDGDVVTQLPIGYSKPCARLKESFTNCTSEEMKKSRKKKPLYYNQKHKYIVPPPNMFAKEYLNEKFY